jgi:hypothetical protein
MNPSVDVGCPPRPFRHLRMAERCTPDPSSSRAPVHSALVQKSVTRHHQPGRPAFNLDARGKARWLARGRCKKDGTLVACGNHLGIESPYCGCLNRTSSITIGPELPCTFAWSPLLARERCQENFAPFSNSESNRSILPPSAGLRIADVSSFPS